MKSINVDKVQLIEKLKENRAAHRAIFEEAITGYREQAIKLLDEQLTLAKTGKKFRTYFELVEPVDQTRDYNRALGMLEMSKDSIVELSEADYRQYVLDDWSWKGQFWAANSSYSALCRNEMREAPTNLTGA